ncbi:MAG TPA: SPFH/Band 7/PHB domain protein, partial [Bacteroidales bacterium]|nr:SPFH/Band 7/PHB domain protein [Bacteroidales bacterium]
MTGVTVILIIVVAFIFIFAMAGLKIVQQAQTMIIERFGKYNRTLSSGINIIWPIIDKPREIAWRYTYEDTYGNIRSVYKRKSKIDLRETVYDFPKQNVITKDNVGTEINALIYFQIIDPKRAVYEIENLPQAIEKLTQTTLRNVIGELDLDETLISRDLVNTKLQTILDEATNKWGVKVNRVELQDINPPEDIRAAMEKQMRAERDRRATILEAEGAKRAQILNAEGFKESKINQAEGEKQSKILKAEGEAEAKIKVAEAEAKAIEMITSAISTKADPTNYLIAIKYIETLKEMVNGKDNKVIYMPYEASGILSSIGGIKEMLE